MAKLPTVDWKFSKTGQVMESGINTIERVVCVMYHAASTKHEVNKCRRQLLAQYRRQLEKLPRTQDSLKQHVLRAVYQAAFAWAPLLISMQNRPSPDEWGSKKQGNNFVPCWMTQPSVSEAFKERTICGCKANKGCSGRCSCKKVGLPCTKLCKCGGMCDWTKSSFILLSDSQVTLFLFVFVFLSFVEIWVVIIAPRFSFIDYLLKTLNFTKKEALGPEKKTS